MKIIDAVWEKRNLGVSCYELQMRFSDCAEEVAAALDSLDERQYMVVKVPSQRVDLMRLCQIRGYSFIETAIALEFNYKQLGYKVPNMTRSLQKICDKCSWGLMDQAELAQLSDEIMKNIFRTDRIFVDPEFTPAQAAQRYDLWVKDLIRNGNIPYKVCFEGEIIGFFVGKNISAKVNNSILGGLYTKYADSGMGCCMDYAHFMAMLEQGVEKSITQVSGSNPAVLKLHTAFGAEIKGLEYVFVKHNVCTE